MKNNRTIRFSMAFLLVCGCVFLSTSLGAAEKSKAASSTVQKSDTASKTKATENVISSEELEKITTTAMEKSGNSLMQAGAKWLGWVDKIKKVNALVWGGLQASLATNEAEFLKAWETAIVDVEPVKPWLDDSSVSEIMINGPENIYIEKGGRVVKVESKFPSEPALQAAANNIAKSVGRVLNDEYPRLDARLPDGSRVHVVIPPLSRCGTVVSIRKFRTDSLSPESLVKWQSISQEMLDYLKKLVQKRMNILICGATSSGKTSILNVLSTYIDPADRILTIEDSCELQLRQPHLVPFETRRPDKDGKGEVTFRDLLHSALRLRPDRIILGEIRGGEALDLLQAMNTGHSGSMSTIHANNAYDSLLRLETCVMYAGFDLPLSAIRNQVVAALNYIVHTGRLEDGSRKVLGISKVLPLEHGEYHLESEWEWTQTGTDESGKFIGKFNKVQKEQQGS